MTNLKIKIIQENDLSVLETKSNEFLSKLDEANVRSVKYSQCETPERYINVVTIVHIG